MTFLYQEFIYFRTAIAQTFSPNCLHASASVAATAGTCILVLLSSPLLFVCVLSCLYSLAQGYDREQITQEYKEVSQRYKRLMADVSLLDRLGNVSLSSRICCPPL